MKRITRVVLALTILLIVAQPTFASCVTCLDTGDCGWGDGLFKCKPTINGCRDSTTFCPQSVASLASEYRIASVEITHGSDAKVQVAEKKTAQPQTARIAEARK